VVQKGYSKPFTILIIVQWVSRASTATPDHHFSRSNDSFKSSYDKNTHFAYRKRERKQFRAGKT